MPVLNAGTTFLDAVQHPPRQALLPLPPAGQGDAHQGLPALAVLRHPQVHQLATDHVLLTADALLAIARVLYCAPILPGSTRICKGDRPHNTGGFIFADHLPHPWVQRITQTIANQVDREGGQEDE